MTPHFKYVVAYPTTRKEWSRENPRYGWDVPSIEYAAATTTLVSAKDWIKEQYSKGVVQRYFIYEVISSIGPDVNIKENIIREANPALVPPPPPPPPERKRRGRPVKNQELNQAL